MGKSTYNEVFARFLSSKDGLSGFRNKIIARKVLEILKPASSDRILEIGCNTGELIKKLIVRSKNVVGIDINHTALKISNMPNLFCMDAANMDFLDGSFDKIVCIHTIEHVHRIEIAFEEMDRVLRPGGFILLIYPLEIIRGMAVIRQTLASYSSKWLALVTGSFISKARELHIHKLSPGKINRLIAGSGLSFVSGNLFLNPWPAFLTILKKEKEMLNKIH